MAIFNYGVKMIYTPQIKKEVKSVPVPSNFVMDIVEYDFKPPYIALRFYESHWRHMSDKERVRCVQYMSKIKKIIESYKINVTLDPVYDVPGGQKI
jgi:hypothetical protein